MNGDDYIGFRREVYPRVAIDSDYSQGSANSRKIKFWFLDENDELQSFNYDYTKGSSYPPGWDMGQKETGLLSDDDDDGDDAMGGMFD